MKPFLTFVLDAFSHRPGALEAAVRFALTATVAALALTRLMMSWDKFQGDPLLTALDHTLVLALLVTLPYPVLATVARSRRRLRR